MTRFALGAFDPLVVALARGSGAGVAAICCVAARRYALPSSSQWIRIGLAAAGMVFVFPILTSIALEVRPASHVAAIAAVLPLGTALVGVLRGRESAPPLFWIAASIGTVIVFVFALRHDGSFQFADADILILVACAACAYGYAEGGLLAREMGGWRTICWILTVSLPISLASLIGWISVHGFWRATPTVNEWVGLSYSVLITQFIGFFLYYRGLGLGGVAKMSQVQLFQSPLGVAAAGVLLGEVLDLSVVAAVVSITICVATARFAMRRGKRM
jgi:drug/metabolite transporter (DMT)-like permease